MLLKGVRVGFALTGSFCTFDRIMPEIERVVSEGAEVLPIFSENVAKNDTRFGSAEDWKSKVFALTGRQPIMTITEAEPIGPKQLLDILVIAPCTGNTLGKLANGITDSTVTMAAKAHLRNNKPVVIAISTNDGLGANAKNLGILINTKNIFFVPFGQDDPMKKCNSLLADNTQIIPTILDALEGRQIQPVLIR
jgi:dipicolinate synthase subunit B